MTIDGYWDLIARALADADDVDEVPEGLEALLAPLAPDELLSFIDHEAATLRRAYRRDLWGVAYVINGGCSDDGFAYFRGWLIAQGRAVFEAALADPDSLGQHADDEAECEDLLYVAAGVYEQVTGREPPSRASDDGEPAGEAWDFDDDDEMARRYPRTWAKVEEE